MAGVACLCWALCMGPVMHIARTLQGGSLRLPLLTCISKKETPTILASIVRSKIHDEFSGFVNIYTDASKTTTGRVGIGCYIQSTSTTSEYAFEARLTDGVSVYTGELTAVKLAVENIRMLENTTHYTKFAVFTDSLSTAESFISGRSNSRPALYAETLDLLNKVKGRIILVWLLSHIGIEGNEKADKLASLGAGRPTVDFSVGLELREAYEQVDVYIKKLWQEQWKCDPTGRHLYSIRPLVGLKEHRLFNSRATDVTSFRLRLGKCRLNDNLHRIGCHETGVLSGVNFNVPSILQNSLLSETIHKLSDRRL